LKSLCKGAKQAQKISMKFFIHRRKGRKKIKAENKSMSCEKEILVLITLLKGIDVLGGSLKFRKPGLTSLLDALALGI